MRRACLAGLLACFLASVALAEAGWVPGGTVKVNGNAVRDARFIKKERRIAFPFLAIAQALGKKAVYDAKAGTVDWQGKSFHPREIVVVEGVPYAGWRDLSLMEPQLEYGMTATEAVFAMGARKTMPTAGSKTDPSPAGGAVVVVNSKNPGEALDLKACLVSGHANVVMFSSQY